LGVALLMRAAYVEHVTNQVRQMGTQISNDAQRNAELLRQKQQEAERLRQSKAADLKRDEIAEERRRIAEKNAVLLARSEAQQNRELAWQKFYKKSPQCVNPKPSDTVRCSNEFIRAKSKFDAEWDLNQGAVPVGKL